MTTGASLRVDPADFGTLELDGLWVPYLDFHDLDFIPTRLEVGNDEYAFHSSMIIRGHSAVLPARIRDLRATGKKPLVVERDDRYYVFITPP